MNIKMLLYKIVLIENNLQVTMNYISDNRENGCTHYIPDDLMTYFTTYAIPNNFNQIRQIIDNCHSNYYEGLYDLFDIYLDDIKSINIDDIDVFLDKIIYIPSNILSNLETIITVADSVYNTNK